MSALRAPESAGPQAAGPVRTVDRRRRRRAPRLRLVARPAGRVRRWPLMVVSAFLVGGLLVAVVATQALVNQTSFKMRDLQEQTKATRQTYVQLRLQVADLSAPDRIVAKAIALGLRLPDAQELQVLQVRTRSPLGSDNRPARPSFGLKGLIGEHP